MREIKFRAWVKTGWKGIIANKIMEIAYITGDGSMCNIDGSCASLPNEYIKIMQYTGLKDRNEREIYEGDVVRLDDKYNGLIAWDLGRWQSVMYLHDLDIERYFDLYITHSNLEIIGNIYENPELLKDE